jgi:DNA-binding winged helix-turn-helix (wHTH) protein/tetratricopeptide (TPR) repeat protein
MSLISKRIYQFGEFELRVSARVLARGGKPIPLGSKAFEVLTCLVSNAGEVVTKDELLKTVWPESFVEEGNLSQHVFALRKALGDCSTYIVTIPGRGYQFTESVRCLVEGAAPPAMDSGTFVVQRTRERARVVIDETGPASVSEPTLPSSAWSYEESTAQTADGSVLLNSVRSKVQVTSAEEEVVSSSPPGLPAPKPVPRRKVLLWGIMALAVTALCVGGLFWWRSAHRKITSQKIVLADVENRTGDADFDVVLKKALEIDLDQSPYLDVMSESEALTTLRLMNRTPASIFTPSLAREVCERSNRQVLVAGSIARLGKTYLLTLTANDCESGKRLADAKAEAPSKDETLAALDSAADKLRHGLGESAQSVQQFQVPVAEATTSSLEALKQYSIGEFLLGRMGEEENEVLPYFLRAVQLDPQFAMAQAAIATGYYSLGEYDLAAPYYQRAFELSEHVSEKERLYIRAHYYADDRKDAEAGIKAYRMWADTYPRDWGPWLDIANEYNQLGEYGPAIAAAEQAVRLDPSRGIVYSILARAYLNAGRSTDARSTALRAFSIGKDSYLLHSTLFETAFLEGDQPAMAREIAWSQGKRASEWNFLSLQAFAAASEGRYKQAEQLFHNAEDAAEEHNLPETVDDILMQQASVEVELGLTGVARATMQRIQDRNDRNPEYAFLRAEVGGGTPPGWHGRSARDSCDLCLWATSAGGDRFATRQAAECDRRADTGRGVRVCRRIFDGQ